MIAKYSDDECSASTCTVGARGFSCTSHTNRGLSDLRRVSDRSVVAGQRSLRPWLLLLILQERSLLAFFPVVTHVSASLEAGRCNRARVFGWKLSRL